jgi:hypothetical protein
VQAIFEGVLYVRVPGASVGLRPKVGDVVRAAELQADQVVDFVLAWLRRVDLIFAVNSLLF